MYTRFVDCTGLNPPGVREIRVRAPVQYQADGVCMVSSYLFTNRLDACFEKTKATALLHGGATPFAPGGPWRQDDDEGRPR